MRYTRITIFPLLFFLFSNPAIRASEDLSSFCQSLLQKLPINDSDRPVFSETLIPLFSLTSEEEREHFLLLLDSGSSVPQSEKNISDISDKDAVKAAPETHQTIYENRFLRILYIFIEPGQSVPFHTHAWDGVFFTLKGSRFLCNNGNQITEEEWLPGSEIVKGSFQEHSYRNIGSSALQAVLIEYKK